LITSVSVKEKESLKKQKHRAMARVLITGAAGFIGMHTTLRFLKEGFDVIGLDNMNDYYSVDLKRDRLDEIHRFSMKVDASFIMYEKDLNSDVWSSLEKLEIDIVIHLAAQAGVRYSIENPNAYLYSNILGFQKVLEFVELKKISYFCYASSSSVYGKNSPQPFSENAPCNKPESYYAATKKANELMAYSYYKTKQVHSVGLRFFTVYGPWGRPDMAPLIFTNAAYSGEEIKVFNHGNQKRDFTFIDDIVEGVFNLVNSKHAFSGAEVLNIGYGKPSTLGKFIELIEDYSGRKLDKIFVEAQRGDVAETYANTARLFELTGYSPQVNLEKGLKETIKWYKDHYKIEQ